MNTPPSTFIPTQSPTSQLPDTLTDAEAPIQPPSSVSPEVPVSPTQTSSVPTTLPPLPTPTPLKRGIPIIGGALAIMALVGIVGVLLMMQSGKGLSERGGRAPAPEGSSKPGQGSMPAFNTRSAPNPACNKSCQTSLDCEAGSGGTTMLLDCIKEDGAPTGSCRNSACSSIANCMCQ